MDDMNNNVVNFDTNQSENFSASPLVENMRNLFAGPQVLALIICFALSIVFLITSNVMTSKTSYYKVGEMLEDYNPQIAAEYYNYLNEYDIMESAAGIGTVLGTCLGSLPNIMVLIGFILVYTAAKDRTKPMSLSGFSVLKVMNIIGLVCYIILAVLIALFVFLSCLLVFSAGGGYTALSIIGIISLGLIVLLIDGIIVLFICKNVGLNNSINAITGAFQNSFPKKISGFACGMLMVEGIFTAIAGFSSLIGGEFISAVSFACMAVAKILLSISLNKLRDMISFGNVNA